MTIVRDFAENIQSDGDLIVSGDLQVSGTTTTVNSTTVEIGDKNIVLGANATANSQNDGGGISILLPDPSPDEFATFTHTGTTWNLSDALSIDSGNLNIVSGNFQIGGTTVIDGSQNATFAGGATFGGDSSVYTGALTGEFNVGRSSSQQFNFYVTDNQGYIRYYQEETDATNHSVNFQIISSSTGANIFKFNRGATFEGDIATPSGNVFVGKSSVALGTDGTNITGTSTVISASSGNTYHVYNTNTSTYPFVVSFDGNVTAGTINSGAITSTGKISATQGGNFNTNTGAYPFRISRGGSDVSQVLSISITDTQALFNYTEDTSTEGSGNYGNYVFQVSGDSSPTGPVQILSMNESSAVFAGSISAAGNITVAKDSNPVLILDDTDATNATNLVSYVSFRKSGTESGYVGYGSSANSNIYLNGENDVILRSGSTDTVTVSGSDTTFAGNINLSGDSRSITMLDGTTSSQPSIAIGEQSLFGFRQRWDSLESVQFEGWWNSTTGGAVNRDFGSLDVNNLLWTFKNNVNVGGELRINGTTVINSSRNVDAVGLTSSTLKLGQTAQNLEDFTAVSDWAKPAGYSSMLRGTNQNASVVGTPVSANYWLYNVFAKRDTAGGTAGLLLNYDNSDFYTGFWSASTDSPAWKKVVHDGSSPSFSALTVTGDADLGSGHFGPSAEIGIGDAAAAYTSVGHNASVNEGIFWHSSATSYGIWREAGNWTSPSYPPLVINWETGIKIKGGSGSNGYTYEGVAIESPLSVTNNATFTGTIDADYLIAAPGTSGTTAANRAFQVNKTTYGAVHVTSGTGGTSGSADTVPLLTTLGSAATEVQSGIYLSQNSSGGTTLGIFVSDDYAVGPKQTFTCEDNGTVRVNRGDLTVTGNVTAYFSDERLKNRTGSIEDSLEKLKSLDAFTYTATEFAQEKASAPKKSQLGLSAQQVQKIAPEVVSLAPFDIDPSAEEEKSLSGENYLTLDYSRLVPLLVQGIKDLTAKVEEQQNQIEELKRK